MKEKILYIIRALPGAGKSTLAKQLVPEYCIFEADKFFEDEWGNYNFDSSKLGAAHNWCKYKVENAMQINNGETARPFGEGTKEYNKLVVSNTSTTTSEIKPYMELAQKYGYKTVVMVLENYHSGQNIHNVPVETLQKMEQKLKNSIKLINEI